MYCVNCGVKLSDTEKRCPLCQTAVYHPDLPLRDAEPLYPEGLGPGPQLNSLTMQSIITATYLIAILVSPMGLPMAAAWMVGKVQVLRYAIQERVYR